MTDEKQQVTVLKGLQDLAQTPAHAVNGTIQAVSKPVVRKVENVRDTFQTKESKANKANDTRGDDDAEIDNNTHLKNLLSVVTKPVVNTAESLSKPLVHTAENIKDTLNQRLSKNTAIQPEEENVLDNATAALPPDERLEDMEKVITKQLQNTSIQQIYETCWSDNAVDFYRGFLEQTKQDVVIQPWSVQDCVGDWDGETYSQMRTISLRFHPPLATGLANVTYTQYARFQENDRCIITTKVQTTGVPFSDAFSVQLRWVATRMGNRNVRINSGVFVIFTKQVLVASKIRSVTLSETKKAETSFFQQMRDVLGCPEQQEPTELLTITPNPFVNIFHGGIFRACFPFSEPELKEDDDIHIVLRQIHDKLRTIEALPEGLTPQQKADQSNYIQFELAVAQEALSQILGHSFDADKSIESNSEVNRRNKFPLEGQVKTIILDPLRNFGLSTKRFLSSIPMGPVSRASVEREDTSSRQAEGGIKQEEEMGPFAPDRMLPTMSVVVTKTIPQCTIAMLHDKCFGDSSRSFLHTWMERMGRRDIMVGEWEKTPSNDPYIDDWSGEPFNQRRKTCFKVPLNLVLSASVLSTHHLVTHSVTVEMLEYFRVFGQHKLVVSSRATMSGLPFGDAFTVQLRWVASRVIEEGESNLKIKVGVFVVFSKKTLLANKIRAETVRHVTKSQTEFCRAIRAAVQQTQSQTSNRSIRNQVSVTLDQDIPALPVAKRPLETCFPQVLKLSRLYPESMVRDDPILLMILGKTFDLLAAVRLVVKSRQDDAEGLRFILSQLWVVHESLDNIIEWHANDSGENVWNIL